MDALQKQLGQMLLEAHSNELALINVLTSHEGIAEPGDYKNAIRAHLRETRRHADKLERRIERLGFNRKVTAAGYGLLQNMVKQGLVLIKGPIDMLRGGDVKEKMVRNARDEAMTEGLEIATYDTIEALARSLGDIETAELAAEIREDEVRMLETLRSQIPDLVAAMVSENVPAGRLAAEEPWSGYDGMTVDEIRARLDDASQSLALTVKAYEKRNKNRTTVLKAAEREAVAV